MEAKTLTQAAAGGRQAYIDNIRWTVIVMVVLMHACVTYSGMGSWFYNEATELDIASTLVFSIYQTFAQAFFMGLLFFFAGTLIPSAYDRKGLGHFLLDRLVRLGVPSLVFMLILDPATNLIRDAGTGAAMPWAEILPAYRDYVLSGRFLSASGPMWFAVALLLFTAAYALVRVVRDLIRASHAGTQAVEPGAPRKLSSRSIHVAAGCIIAVIAVAAFLVRLAQPIGTSIMNMQLGFFSSYIVLFAAGLWVGRNGLLQSIPGKVGRTWLWLSIGVGLPVWLLLLGMGGALEGKGDLYMGGLHWQAAGYALWESFFCVAFGLGLTTVYRERVNRKTRITGLLTYTGFGIYTFHAPILVGVSILMRAVTMYPLAKTLVVAAIAWLASLAFAWVVRKIPGVGKLFA